MGSNALSVRRVLGTTAMMMEAVRGRASAGLFITMTMTMMTVTMMMMMMMMMTTTTTMTKDAVVPSAFATS